MSALKPIPFPLLQEGERISNICNACRYCEGFCAAFPALERRMSFAEADLTYLANLCHNCGACYYSCQYAAPHEFNVNFPKVMAELRVASYKKYAWPGFMAAVFDRNGLVVSLIAALSLSLFLLTMSASSGANMLAPHSDSAGSFYALISHKVMAWMFSSVALFDAMAFSMAFRRFWKDTGGRFGSFLTLKALGNAVRDAMQLRYLDGGGDGCTYPNENFSPVRRRFHHFTFYGFNLCFAATSVAAIYHYVFGWHAPYPLTSLPVLLGVSGGIGLLIGPIGLLWLKYKRDLELVEKAQTGMDVSFLALLLLSSATGLALLTLRQSGWMGIMLALHLGSVMALFLTMPYGKFVHGIYRMGALVQFHSETAWLATGKTGEAADIGATTITLGGDGAQKGDRRIEPSPETAGTSGR